MGFKQCRTCLCESEHNELLEDTISIFNSQMKIAELVMACASVKIITEDLLPNIICSVCVEYASTAFKFKRKCEESEKQLRLKLLNTKLEVANITENELQIAEIYQAKNQILISQSVLSHNDFNYTSDQFDSDDDTPLLFLKYQSDKSDKSSNQDRCSNRFDNSNTHRQNNYCSICKKEFTDASVMRKHRLICKNRSRRKNDDKMRETIRICAVCSLEFENQKLLREHQTQHTDIKCPDCGKCFSTFRKVRRHKLQHCKVRFPPQFHCTVCRLPFSNTDELTEHRQIHNDRTCEYCGKNIMKEYEQKHLQIHEKNGLECLQCDATFSTLSSYREHISFHTTFTCSDCPEIFTDIHHFRSHKQHHFFNDIQPEYSTECSECDQPFGDRNLLFQHFLTHTSYKCRTCKKRLRTLPELAKHSRTKACEKELSKRTCDVCGRVFNRVAHLHRHMCTHNAHVSKCKFCEFESERPSNLAQHMISSHDDMRNVKCPDCGKKFFTKFNMQQHMTIHTGQRRHVCDYCGKVFALGNYLKEHIRIHTGERAYSCTVCHKQFIQYRSLVSHMDMHLPRQQHVCPLCGKIYPRKAGMRIHMKRHLNERPFQCSACCKAFKTKQEMEKHMETHSGVRNYICTDCGKGFGRKYALTVHARIHTGETPHECGLCGKGFIQAHCLRRHMKTHH